MVWVIVVALLAAATWFVGHQQERALLETWRRVAAQFGLSFGFVDDHWSMTGSLGGFGVRVRMVKRGKVQATELALASSGIPKRLTLKSEGGWQSLRKLVVGEDVLTGDREFDAMIHVTGPEAVALAVLDAPARARVKTFVRGWAEAEALVSDGQLNWQNYKVLAEGSVLTALIKDALGTAQALQLLPDQVQGDLALNAAQDPVAAVRLRNLEVLARVAPEVAAECLRVALTDPDGSVRVFAATRLGESELPRLLELAQRDRDPAVRAKVIRHLASFTREKLWPILDSAIGARDDDLKRAAIVAAGETRYTALLPRVAALADSAEPLVAQAVAQALHALGAREYEATLVSLLGHQASEVRTAAARALGDLGGGGAVEPLLAQTKGVFEDATLKRTALQAIARIQSRLDPAEVGRLSLVEPAPLEGALSTVGDEANAGALSVLADASEIQEPERANKR